MYIEHNAKLRQLKLAVPDLMNKLADGKALGQASFDSCDEYLQVKYAKLVDPSPFPTHPTTVALILAQNFELVGKRDRCVDSVVLLAP